MVGNLIVGGAGVGGILIFGSRVVEDAGNIFLFIFNCFIFEIMGSNFFIES